MPDGDHLWYKDAIIYEVHVRAFHDSIGDGMGDFRGLTQKLDYLQDLGITAIWLLPFYPSPLKDDGYDVANYTDVHPHYGTLQDFREFLEAAHQRGLRVITELVINHTSDQHPWFQRARKAPPGSVERDFYVWSDHPNKYLDARIIFKDFEHSNWTYDHVAGAYYWHRFYSHQPDLNYDNPAVWEALFPIFDFWMDMGVDGMRLDAIPYLYEREGTNCENLPETHVFLKALRKRMDERYPGRMFLAEANQWPEDALAYFGDGDECHMAFHFPLMPRMFMSIHMEDRYPIIDILDQTPPIPDNCQWCMFLRNHDELTLEMVTEEERDYMYRAYASEQRARINLGIRRRLAPLLGNDRRRIELMNGLLFSMPGSPVIYYGDEIGMGDNIYLGDRNGVRTPMQWSADRNAGFSRCNPQRLYLPIIIDPEYHYESINVEAQQNNPNSLLWWMKRLIAQRKGFKAFGRGSLEFLHPSNRKILAFLRRYTPPEGGPEEIVLVVANLSRHVQQVQLDLGRFQGLGVRELFGRHDFPPIGKDYYPLTLGPHAFYWFSLAPQHAEHLGDLSLPREVALPTLSVKESWEELFQRAGRARLEEILPSYLAQRNWFNHQAEVVDCAIFREPFRVVRDGSPAFVTLVQVEFNAGEPETYVLPLAFASREMASTLMEKTPGAVLAWIAGGNDGVLYDALASPNYCAGILRAIAEERVTATTAGELACSRAPGVSRVALSDIPADIRVWNERQSNTSVFFGDRFVLKIFRRVQEGVNPELELGRFLATREDFLHQARLLGAIEYRQRGGDPATLAVLHAYVANEGTAWQYTLDEVGRFFERVVSLPPEQRSAPVVQVDLLSLAEADLPATAEEALGRYLDSARLLGVRTAEMHLALTSDTEDPALKPEPMGKLYQRSVYQSLRTTLRLALYRIRSALPGLSERVAGPVSELIRREKAILDRFHPLLDRKLTGQRTRLHGDFHLGQILYTGKDFVVIDYEGNTSRPVSERRVKRSPLRDVAGLLLSFDHAVFGSLANGTGQRSGTVRPEDVGLLEQWSEGWRSYVSAAYLRAYLDRLGSVPFLPAEREDLRDLLAILLLERALFEIAHELERYPERLGIPARAVLRVLEGGV